MANNRGFTLLEVMVALLIMAVLTMLTAQSLKSAVDNKVFVTREIGKDSALADTLRIMRQDIAQAFHYQNIFCKMAGDSTASPTGAAPAAGGPAAAGGFGFNNQANPSGSPTPCPPDTTGFVGSGDSLYFTTLSNTRTIRDSQESDQAKIGYFLKSCHSHVSKANTQCLYRSVSPYLDEDVDKPGKETLLLDNVDEFKLRYLGPKHQDYLNEWKTGKFGDDEVAKKNFPYAVEITLTVYDKGDPKDRKATAVVLAPLAFENNPPAQATPGPNGVQPGVQGQGAAGGAAQPATGGGVTH